MELQLDIPGRLCVYALIYCVCVSCLAECSLSCYDCKVDQRKHRETQSPCIYAVNNSYTPRVCQSHENMCKIESVRVNRVIRTFERNCAQACSEGCQTIGFGVDTETCIFCCDTDGCNFNLAQRVESWIGLTFAAIFIAYKSAYF